MPSSLPGHHASGLRVLGSERASKRRRMDAIAAAGIASANKTDLPLKTRAAANNNCRQAITNRTFFR